MEPGRQRADRGQRGRAQRGAPECDPQADEDQPDVLDTGVRQRALQVALQKRLRDSEERADEADQDQPAPTTARAARRRGSATGRKSRS